MRKLAPPPSRTKATIYRPAPPKVMPSVPPPPAPLRAAVAPPPAAVPTASAPAVVAPRELDWFVRLQGFAERAERSAGVRVLRALVVMTAVGLVYVVVSLALTMPFMLVWLFK